MRILPLQVESLWTLFTAPIVWALHFLACYLTVAIFCAKDGRLAGYQSLQWVLAGVTLAALGAIVVSAFLAWRQWSFGTADPPHDAPTRHDRMLFQGFATLLLSGLSFVAVLFVVLPLLTIKGCIS